MPRPPDSHRRDSRGLVLAAARAEFAAHGFSGAGVDRIAARARVNKAMIYYHFGSKIGLYREVLRDGFLRLIARARAATGRVSSPVGKFDAYIASLLHSAAADPHLVPIVLREIASGGRHIDAETLRLMTGLFDVVRDIIDAGQAAGEFGDMDPLLTHFVVMGSTMFCVANAPIRAKVRRARLLRRGADVPAGPQAMARRLGIVLRRMLALREGTADHA